VIGKLPVLAEIPVSNYLCKEKESVLRYCLWLVASCFLATAVGCGSPAPPPPTAEEAAKAPPVEPPVGKDSSRAVID
jgi:hypothetical protein